MGDETIFFGKGVRWSDFNSWCGNFLFVRNSFLELWNLTVKVIFFYLVIEFNWIDLVRNWKSKASLFPLCVVVVVISYCSLSRLFDTSRLSSIHSIRSRKSIKKEANFEAKPESRKPSKTRYNWVWFDIRRETEERCIRGVEKKTR